MIQTYVTGRLLLVRHTPPLLRCKVGQFFFREPPPRRIFLLAEKNILPFCSEREEPANLFLPLLESFQILRIHERHLPLCHLGTRKGGIDPVVVASWNRIKLVIVTLGTPQIRRKKCLPNRIHHIIQINLTCFRRLHHGTVPWPHP